MLFKVNSCFYRMIIKFLYDFNYCLLPNYSGRNISLCLNAETKWWAPLCDLSFGFYAWYTQTLAAVYLRKLEYAEHETLMTGFSLHNLHREEASLKRWGYLECKNACLLYMKLLSCKKNLLLNCLSFIFVQRKSYLECVGVS